MDASLPKKPSYAVPDMSWKRDDIRDAEKYQRNKKSIAAWDEIEKMRAQRDHGSMDLADWKKADLAEMKDYLQNTPSSGWVLGLTSRSNVGESYVSQGQSTNNCGPASLAITLNLVTGTTDWDLSNVSVGLRLPDLGDGNDTVQWALDKGNIPVQYQNIVGATSAEGVATAFNKIARQNNIPFEAEHISGATQNNLVTEIEAGNPVAIVRVWQGGGAHYQVVVGYDAPSDTVYFVDPGDQFSGNPVQSEDWSTQFNLDWSRPLDAIYRTYQNEMVVFRPKP